MLDLHRSREYMPSCLKMASLLLQPRYEIPWLQPRQGSASQNQWIIVGMPASEWSGEDHFGIYSYFWGRRPGVVETARAAPETDTSFIKQLLWLIFSSTAMTRYGGFANFAVLMATKPQDCNDVAKCILLEASIGCKVSRLIPDHCRSNPTHG